MAAERVPRSRTEYDTERRNAGLHHPVCCTGRRRTRRRSGAHPNMRIATTLSALALGLSLTSPSSLADSLVLKSGPAAVPLVELFTSQGCSSCPPADAWLSTLAQREDLWRSFVPLAWHVDYWNGCSLADLVVCQ
jgi:hypothetical protein